ncbi:hypothetical protein G9A89_000839 [Geosiphon pyriformis]|nr:hypothetical protein G9A89_000839 [Geosiphon pyriformis]
MSLTQAPTSSPQPKKQLFEQYTQYRNWRFSKKQLQELREQTNANSVERVRRNIAEEARFAAEKPPRSQNGSPQQQYQNSPLSSTYQNSPLPSSLQNSPRPSNSPQVAPEDVQFLTAQEELALCQYYQAQIQKFPSKAFPEHIAANSAIINQIKATAIVFMKRFYLRNTVMDYHPKDILIASLFLAAKCENATLGHEEFRKALLNAVRQPPSKDLLFQLELAISQSMNYDYAVYHPYKAAQGFFLDMQSPNKMKSNKSQQAYTSAFEKCKDYINKSLLTDLMFFYQPSQIAMGCLILAARKISGFEFERYLEKFKNKTQQEPETDNLFAIIDDICKTIDSYFDVDKNMAGECDRKLRFCTNPAKNNSSHISQKRRDIEREERELKRQKKLKAHKAYQEQLEMVFLDEKKDDKSLGEKKPRK